MQFLLYLLVPNSFSSFFYFSKIKKINNLKNYILDIINNLHKTVIFSSNYSNIDDPIFFKYFLYNLT